MLVSSYLPLHGLWAYGRLSAWLIAHSNPVPTPRPLRGRLINSDSLLRVLLLDSKFFYKSRSSSAAPPRLRCLLQLANKTTRRHVVFRFRSGRTNQNKSFGQAESPIWPSPLRSKALPIITQSPRHRAQSKEAILPLPPLVLPCARLQGNFASPSVHRAEWSPV